MSENKLFKRQSLGKGPAVGKTHQQNLIRGTPFAPAIKGAKPPKRRGRLPVTVEALANEDHTPPPPLTPEELATREKEIKKVSEALEALNEELEPVHINDLNLLGPEEIDSQAKLQNDQNASLHEDTRSHEITKPVSVITSGYETATRPISPINHEKEIKEFNQVTRDVELLEKEWTQATARLNDTHETNGQLLVKRGMEIVDGWILTQLISKIKGAEVWHAEHPQKGESICKMIWAKSLHDEYQLWCFDAEVTLCSLKLIDHPAIPKLIHWGENQDVDCWYTLFEYRKGQTLDESVKRSTYSVDQARGLFIQLADALVRYHSEGMLHRKIHPSHIIFNISEATLISFHWAEGVDGQDELTQHQETYRSLGQKPRYMAPEVLEGAPLSEKSDIYALGMCLLTAVTDRGKSWEDAPKPLQLSIAAATHIDPTKRVNAKTFVELLQNSGVLYLYQSEEGGDHEALYQHEVIERLEDAPYGWHHLRRSNQDGEYIPWSSYPELVNAKETLKQLRTAVGPEPDEQLLKLTSIENQSQRIDEKYERLLERRRALVEEEMGLEQAKNELDWIDDAIRAKEVDLENEKQKLYAREAELADLEETLTQREQALTQREEEINQRADFILHQYQDLESQRIALEELKNRLAGAQVQQVSTSTEDDNEIGDDGASIREAAQKIAEENAQKAHEELLKLEMEEQQRVDDLIRYETELAIKVEQRRIAREEERKAFRDTSIQSNKQSKPIVEAGSVLQLSILNQIIIFRYCPAGIFWMGNDQIEAPKEQRPQHKVKLSEGFWLAEIPITQEQWSAIMGHDRPPKHMRNVPVYGLRWREALAGCIKLSSLLSLDPAYELDPKERGQERLIIESNGVRLPSEAQWEYAARCGKTGRFHQYSGGGTIDESAWYIRNAGDQPHDVRQKIQNAWGFYDLCGNIWEWCADNWRADEYRNRVESLTYDPLYFKEGINAHVVRGGAWYDFPKDCTIANRPGLDYHSGFGVGFRPVIPESANVEQFVIAEDGESGS